MDSQEESQPSQGSFMTVIEEERHEVLYFAYGSNLSTEQMRQRCPFSTAIGLGFLPGWRWIINERGFANIVPLDHVSSSDITPDPAGGVYGLLYLLPPRDEESLDVFEGVPESYDKAQCQARWVRDGDAKPIPGEGTPVKVLVYVDEKRTSEAAPRTEYIGRMERGIEDAVQNWGMDADYANRVMRKYWTSS